MVLGTVLAVASACGDPTSVGESSTFSADVSGSKNGRLVGSATVTDSREIAVQVTVPNVGPVSAVALTANGGANVLAFARLGTELPVGTHRLGATSDFTGGYMVRRADNSQQVFFADSGSLTITESGARVVGSFKFYASRYAVFAPITSATVFPVRSISDGTEKLAIVGTFNAVRR
jgi:hypothetical protein